MRIIKEPAVEVYAHPCHWTRGPVEQVGASVDDLAAALAGRPSVRASRPREVTFDGHEGTHLRLQVPLDISFGDCSASEYRSWTALPGGVRFHQGPGQIDEVWILDVDGTRVVVNIAYFPQTSKERRNELMQIVESIRFA